MVSEKRACFFAKFYMREQKTWDISYQQRQMRSYQALVADRGTHAWTWATKKSYKEEITLKVQSALTLSYTFDNPIISMSHTGHAWVNLHSKTHTIGLSQLFLNLNKRKRSYSIIVSRFLSGFRSYLETNKTKILHVTVGFEFFDKVEYLLAHTNKRENNRLHVLMSGPTFAAFFTLTKKRFLLARLLALLRSLDFFKRPHWTFLCITVTVIPCTRQIKPKTSRWGTHM